MQRLSATAITLILIAGSIGSVFAHNGEDHGDQAHSSGSLLDSHWIGTAGIVAVLVLTYYLARRHEPDLMSEEGETLADR